MAAAASAAESWKGTSSSAPLRQQLLGVPVRRRDHCLAVAQRVGERARDDLGGVQVGRHVQIGGPQELAQLFQGHEAIVEHDVVGDAELARPHLKVEAVLLSLLALDVRDGSRPRTM